MPSTLRTRARVELDRMFVSRFCRLKKDADRLRRTWRALGATRLTLTGKRGLYRVRGKMAIRNFAHFCSNEAHEALQKAARA